MVFPGIGTVVNVIAVLVGSSVGLLLGARLSTRTRDTVTDALGLVTLLIGALSAAEVGFRGAGGRGGVRCTGADRAWCPAVGRHCRLIARHRGSTGGFRQLAANAAEAASLRRTATRFHQDPSPPGAAWTRFRGNGFHRGCTLRRCRPGALHRGLRYRLAGLLRGSTTILGSLSDGLGRGADQLILKAALDGFASIAFAAALGAGVMASVVAIVVVQGSLTLVGVMVGSALPEAQLASITATGGPLLLGVGLRLLQIKAVPVGNLLPALLVAPALVWIVAAFR